MSRLERRCRRLLRAYPQSYRTERGEEILATLLDAAPADHDWPPARDAWSLITGGLRVRAARNRQLPLAANLRLAALLAAALWLGNSAATFLELAIRPGAIYGQLPALSKALFAACALGAGPAIASAWFWRRSVTVTLALAVTAACVLACRQTGFDGLAQASLAGPPLALAALATGKDRPPRCWLWIPGLYLIAPLPALLASSHGWWRASGPDQLVFAGIVVVALLWLAADTRPAIALGMYLEVMYLLPSYLLLGPGLLLVSYPQTPPGRVLIMALIPAALAAAALRVRRKATI